MKPVDPWPKLPMPEQHAPVANNQPAVWGEVIKDMQARDAIGRERYGVPLQPGNGRNALRDMYEEQLDWLAYAKQSLMEREMLRTLLEETRRELRESRFASGMGLLDRALELLPVGRKP